MRLKHHNILTVHVNRQTQFAVPSAAFYRSHKHQIRLPALARANGDNFLNRKLVVVTNCRNFRNAFRLMHQVKRTAVVKRLRSGFDYLLQSNCNFVTAQRNVLRKLRFPAAYTAVRRIAHHYVCRVVD